MISSNKGKEELGGLIYASALDSLDLAQQLKRAASSRDKVSCRKQRRQQATEVPHSALAARAPAPTSSLEA